MGKMFGLISIILALWGASEIYTKGIDGAFDGLFASESGEAESRDQRSVPQRAGDSAQRAYREADERRNRMLAE